jgi:hypothetical protein
MYDFTKDAKPDQIAIADHFAKMRVENLRMTLNARKLKRWSKREANPAGLDYRKCNRYGFLPFRWPRFLWQAIPGEGLTTNTSRPANDLSFNR